MWKGISVAVFILCSGYRYLSDGGNNLREMFHDGIPYTYRSQTDLLPFWDGTRKGNPNPKFGRLIAKISKMVSRSVTMSIRA